LEGARFRISALERSSVGQIPHIEHRQRDILSRRRCPAFSGLHGAEQGGNAEDVDGSPQVVGERCKAELGIDVGKATMKRTALSTAT